MTHRRLMHDHPRSAQEQMNFEKARVTIRTHGWKAVLLIIASTLSIVLFVISMRGPGTLIPSSGTKRAAAAAAAAAVATSSAQRDMQLVRQTIDTPRRLVAKGLDDFAYHVNVMLESNSSVLIVLLIWVTLATACLGGGIWFFVSNNQVLHDYGYLKPQQRRHTVSEAVWRAWGCMVAASNHTKEKGALRALTLTLAVAGIMTYSVSTGAFTSLFRLFIDRRAYGYASPTATFRERGQVAIIGVNTHLLSILEMLDRTNRIALARLQNKDTDARTPYKHVVVVVEDEAVETKEMLQRNSHRWNTLKVSVRQGALGDAYTYQRIGLKHARHVVVLSTGGDPYDDDARALSAFAAMRPMLPAEVEVALQVSKPSTADLLKGAAPLGFGLRVDAFETCAPKMAVQCARQPALAPVLKEMLGGSSLRVAEPGQLGFSARSSRLFARQHGPELEGLTISELRRGYTDATFVGIVRNAAGQQLSGGTAKAFHTNRLDSDVVRDGNGGPQVVYHPEGSEIVSSSDVMLFVGCAGTYRQPPRELVFRAAEMRRNKLKQATNALARSVDVAYANVHAHVSGDSSSYEKDIIDVPVMRTKRGGGSGTYAPSTTATIETQPHAANYDIVHDDTKDAALAAAAEHTRPSHLLILGWRPGVEDFITEMKGFLAKGSEVVILAETSVEEREAVVARKLGRLPVDTRRHQLREKMFEENTAAEEREDAEMDAHQSTSSSSSTPSSSLPSTPSSSSSLPSRNSIKSSTSASSSADIPRSDSELTMHKMKRTPPRLLRKDMETALRTQRTQWAQQKRKEKEAKDLEKERRERKPLRIRHLQGKPLSRTDVTNAIRTGFSHTPGTPLSVLCVSERTAHVGERIGDERALFAGALAADIIDEMESAEWLSRLERGGSNVPTSPVASTRPRVGVEVTVQGGGLRMGPTEIYADESQYQGTFGRLYAVPTSELTALYTARRILAGEHAEVNAAERLSLRLAWEQLLSPDGSEIYAKPATLYCAGGSTPTTFAAIESMARRRGEVAIGLCRAGDVPILNPTTDEKKRVELLLNDQDRVVVIAKEAGGID